MKITRKQLRRIIFEEIKKTAIEHDHPSDAKAQEDSWAGGENIHWQRDHSDDLIEVFTAEDLRDFVLSELSIDNRI
jgi:hypothetical protein